MTNARRAAALGLALFVLISALAVPAFATSYELQAFGNGQTSQRVSVNVIGPQPC